MKKRWVTLTEHILKEERKNPKAQGNLTLLLTQIGEASKIIAAHVKNSGLVDIEGAAGKQNVYKEEVQKLDEFTNTLLVDILTESGQVAAMASEEMEEAIELKDSQGEYTVFFDPLDGSGNIDNNNAIGTIFSIYKKGPTLLQEGKRQVAAGYIIYGSSVMFVYSCGAGVNGFTLDPSIGSFLLSHENIRIPEKGITYGVNEGNINLFDDATQKFINSLKGEKPYRLRYAGCMVADIHRVLINGGFFMYPSSKGEPNGKLRLMFEVNPMSYLITQAGGMALSRIDSPLELTPDKLHQRTPIILGGTHELSAYLKFHKK